MTDSMTGAKSPQELPSVDDVRPLEEGGPIARIGYNYQDEITVGFFIDLLSDPSLIKIHCETHDDILLIWEGAGTSRIAEFVQVKGAETEKLWSVADICRRKDGKLGASIAEASLGRDKHKERSRFRVVTLRDVVKDLEILTFRFGSPGRETDGDRFKTLKAGLTGYYPQALSPKGNGWDFWIENCSWDVRYDETSVANDNLLRLMQFSTARGQPLLPEPAAVLLSDLRQRAKIAGGCKWEPDRDKKIILKAALQEWWKRRADEVIAGAAAAAGGKLKVKMTEAGLPDDLIRLAVDLRLEYAAAVRTSKYMDLDQKEALQSRVKSEAASLRSRLIAGQIDLDGPQFHSLCLDRMDHINSERPSGSPDRSSFLKGCMYDIADRCLLRFSRPAE